MTLAAALAVVALVLACWPTRARRLVYLTRCGSRLVTLTGPRRGKL